MVHSSSFRGATLHERRLALLHDLGYLIPEFDIELFLDSFLPPLKDGISIDNTLTSLGRGRHITNGRWTSFNVDPEKFDGKENEAFAHLENIFDKIVEFAMNKERTLKQTLHLRLLPNVAPQSERASNTRPDGFFTLKEAEDRIGDEENGSCQWYDIPGTGEFKMNNDENARDDDVTKIVYTMQHAMTVDPCRRFTFGFTIENTSMRLWFCSRGVMAVTDHRLLTRVFLSLAFADKSELGWDPCIEAYDDSGKRGYRISVGNIIYKVLEVLSEFGADAIIGRATRVFKVERDGKTYVLKDVWVEDDREPGHVIRDRILRDVELKHGKEGRDKVASHLLTPIDHCLVTVDGQQDHTTNVMMRGHVPPVRTWFNLVSKEHEEREGRESKAPMMSSDRNVDEEKIQHIATRSPPTHRTRIQRRRHYRIVFEEVAEPIWTLRKLSDVFLVLRDCAIVLKYLYACGWIHRDISAGNTYPYEGRGLLGDLEYAKIMGSGGTHEMRTGTLDFMALEVLMNDYAFIPSEAQRLDELLNLSGQKVDTTQSASSKGPRSPPFRHNGAHDLESLWWLALFILFFNSNMLSPETDDQMSQRKMWGRLIFPERTPGSEERQKFFRGINKYEAGVSWFPQSSHKLRDRLGLMRRTLVAQYGAFEEEFSYECYEVFDKLHGAIIGGFDYCIDQSVGIQLSPLKVTAKKESKQGPDVPVARQDEANRGSANHPADTRASGSARSQAGQVDRHIQVPRVGKRKAYVLGVLPRQQRQLRMIRRR